MQLPAVISASFPTRKVAVVIVDLNQQFRFNSNRFRKKIATL
jgi:hypothetical protein